MIISRAPVRITISGGGTDLPSYYEKYGGFVLSATINKYVFVCANKYFYNKYSLKYSKIEVEDEIKDIKHELFREALKHFETKPRTELTSLADIPAGTGLGSSGAFLVGLLNTLAEWNNVEYTPRELAELACKIELDILKLSEGKQDKYSCAFSGFNSYEFNKNGDVTINPIRNPDIIKSELKQRLFVFFNSQRQYKAAHELAWQDQKTRNGDQTIIEGLHEVKKIGIESKKAIENGEYDEYGKLLREHWEAKNKIRNGGKNTTVNEFFSYAMNHGATGGKVAGAGVEQGFFIFYCPEKKAEEFLNAMRNTNLIHLPYEFTTSGVTTVFGGKSCSD